MPLPGTQTTLDFERPTYTADSAGGQTPTFAALYSDIDGSLQGTSSKTGEEFAKRSAASKFTFYTTTAINLQTGDRASDGTNYYIVQSSTDEAGQGRVYSADLILKD